MLNRAPWLWVRDIDNSMRARNPRQKMGGGGTARGGSDIPASKKSSTGEWLIAHRVATRSLASSRRERQIETLSRSLGWREHPLSNYALHSSDSYPIAPVVSAAMQLISRRYSDSVRSLVKLYLTGVLDVLDAQRDTGCLWKLDFSRSASIVPPFSLCNSHVRELRQIVLFANKKKTRAFRET